MPRKLTLEHVVSYLEENGCKLLSEYKNTKAKITILCSCGHERISQLDQIKIWKQFLCKKCTIVEGEQSKHFRTKLEEGMHPKTFLKMQRQLEAKLKVSLKYRNDFDPERLNEKLMCLKCNIEKNRYFFCNNKANKSGKTSYCKLCQAEIDKDRVKNHTMEQRIKKLLNSARESVKNKRVKEINIDLEYLLELLRKQNNRCAYSGNELIWIANHINTASLDRIDSSKGYIKGNVQFVSKTVNQAKNNLSEKKFLRMIQQIYRYQHVTYEPKPFDVIQSMKHIRQLLETCKHSIDNRRKKDRDKECLEFDLTIEFILELIIKQRNRCAYTGKELLWLVKNNYSASIDRIDSSKGYTKDNVQLVCKIANQAKNDLTHEQFLTMVNNIYTFRIESDESFLEKYSYCELRETSFLKKLKNKNNIPK